MSNSDGSNPIANQRSYRNWKYTAKYVLHEKCLIQYAWTDVSFSFDRFSFETASVVYWRIFLWEIFKKSKVSYIGIELTNILRFLRFQASLTKLYVGIWVVTVTGKIREDPIDTFHGTCWRHFLLCSWQVCTDVTTLCGSSLSKYSTWIDEMNDQIWNVSDYWQFGRDQHGKCTIESAPWSTFSRSQPSATLERPKDQNRCQDRALWIQRRRLWSFYVRSLSAWTQAATPRKVYI